MKSYNVQPDLTSSGLGSLAFAITRIMKQEAKRVDLGHGTTVYKTQKTPDRKKYTIVVEMEIEEEE